MNLFTVFWSIWWNLPRIIFFGEKMNIWRSTHGVTPIYGSDFHFFNLHAISTLRYLKADKLGRQLPAQFWERKWYIS